MTRDLLADLPPIAETERLADGAAVLRAFAVADAAALLAALAVIAAASPFRRMVTPGGHTMSVAMTNCGDGGWVTDRRGYRYQPDDPETGQPWPALPGLFLDLAGRAAAAAGFAGFRPDACLINRYEPGTRLALHQDRNERDFGQPIVSVSLGLPAIFLFGGSSRSDRPRRAWHSTASPRWPWAITRRPGGCDSTSPSGRRSERPPQEMNGPGTGAWPRAARRTDQCWVSAPKIEAAALARSRF